MINVLRGLSLLLGLLVLYFIYKVYMYGYYIGEWLVSGAC
jgi:hypothetical protein